MFLLAKGTNPQEEIFVGSKLTEISPNRPKGERDYTRPFYTLDIITI